MRIKNTLIQLIYRAVWMVISVVATITTITEHGKFGDGRPTALFFTTWSVWLATLVAIVIFTSTLVRFIKGEKEGYNTAIPLLKFANNIMIIATFIVGGFVLGLFFGTVGNVFKHFLLPIFTVVDAILFDPKNSYRISYPFLGVVLPLLYWIVVVIRMVIFTNGVVEKGIPVDSSVYLNYYPYGFTNLLPKSLAIPYMSNGTLVTPGGHSIGGLCGLLGGILVGLILIGFIFWTLDKLSKKNGKITFDASISSETTTDIFHYLKK